MVNLLNLNCHVCRNGLREGVWLYLLSVVVWIFLETCLAFFVFGELFSIHGNITKIPQDMLIKQIYHLSWKACRWSQLVV